MKILWLASLLCAGFLSFAQIKSFEDLRGIDSKEAFIRVCLENGYQKSYYSDDKKLLYEYVKDEVRYTLKDTITHTKEWTSPIDGETYEGYDLKYKKGEWEF